MTHEDFSFTLRSPAAEAAVADPSQNVFRVWVRTLGNSTRVRVEGGENTRWLLTRLSHSFVFKTSEPIFEEPASACCTFQVQYGSQTSRSGLERLLATMPEVVLMPDPA